MTNAGRGGLKSSGHETKTFSTKNNMKLLMSEPTQEQEKRRKIFIHPSYLRSQIHILHPYIIQTLHTYLTSHIPRRCLRACDLRKSNTSPEASIR
jgi:hypothetical protein